MWSFKACALPNKLHLLGWSECLIKSASFEDGWKIRDMRGRASGVVDRDVVVGWICGAAECSKTYRRPSVADRFSIDCCRDCLEISV